MPLPGASPAAGGELVPFPPAGRATAGLAAWMAVWWLSEAIPVYATALLPLALLPLLSAGTMQDAASPYANELIFLFMGGFFLATAMERWAVHRRIALAIVERNLQLAFEFGAGLALLSKHEFPAQDYGGPLQFALTVSCG